MTAPPTERYTPAYFANQIAKSDTKIAWEYGRLLRFAGVVPWAGMRVADLGCGAAPGLRYLAGRGVSAIGVDVAPAALHAARTMLADSRLVCADLGAGLPFRDQALDLVILREVIEHVGPVEALLAECRRVLAPHGVVLLTTPNLWDARRPVLRLLGRVWSGDADPTHVRLFDPPTLRWTLARAGFGAVRIASGFKPLARVGGRRLPLAVSLPYPPLIGNGLVAAARRDHGA